MSKLVFDPPAEFSPGCARGCRIVGSFCAKQGKPPGLGYFAICVVSKLDGPTTYEKSTTEETPMGNAVAISGDGYTLFAGHIDTVTAMLGIKPDSAKAKSWREYAKNSGREVSIVLVDDTTGASNPETMPHEFVRTHFLEAVGEA